ncbi:hypothetical protein L226DRAFT_568090 [Lentinus tigrinus ALCF2SS1-7]|uniref:uncharacterized protein n=1 Tax=Lentinus tigrinus ALCF2SS1-7 TaxID=1328758 RepID=UPI0011661FDC|nr:hypothetical protein L226DRAFT_568090 [Lentinus tigrinus ALCF2SS1-7]
MFHFPNREDHQLIYESIWVQGQDPFYVENGAEFLRLPLKGCPTVLVRDEYKQIWKLIRTMNENASGRNDFSRGDYLLITGHTGIGKSFFLFYALARALKERIPVVTCTRPRDCHSYLLNAEGVTTVADVERGLELPADTIVLYDSDYEDGPSYYPALSTPALVVHVVRPEAKRWKAAIKYFFPDVWVMGLNTREELVHLQALKEREEPERCGWLQADELTYSPVEIFDLLGPCMRACLHHCDIRKIKDDPQADLIGGETQIDPPGILRLLEQTHTGYDFRNMMLQNDTYTYIMEDVFFLHPRYEDDKKRTCHGLHESSMGYSVPTLFLRQQLAALFRRILMPRDQLKMAEAISGEPQIANVFFEPLVLDALQHHPHGHWCHVLPLGGGAIGDRTGTQAADLDFRLGPGLVLERIVDKALFRPADNRVYVPLPGVLPGISAIVVSEDGARATMLQLDLAIQPKHSSMLWEYKRVISKRVICEAIDMFPAERGREMKWSILLPTTKDQGRNVKLVGDLTLPEGYPAVDIGWMRVGGSWELLEVLHLLAQHDRDDLQIDAYRQKRK